MKTILHSFFGRADTASGAPSVAANSAHAPTPSTTTSEITVHRQLVDQLLAQLLRRSGIPAGWIEAQMLVLTSRTRGNGAHLRLVLRHGDDHLLKYIFALQKQLQKDINDADSHAAQWLQGISWQLEIDGSCQRTELPEKSFWQPVIEAQELKNPTRKIPVARDPKLQPATENAAPKVNGGAPAAAAPVTVTPLNAAAATAATAASLQAAQALRQLREARALARSPSSGTTASAPLAQIAPTLSVAPRHAAAHSVTAMPAQAEPLVSRMAAPIKPQKPPAADRQGLDYGAPNFECSRPAEETDLTPDLAALFALDDSQWKTQAAKVTQATKA